LKLHALINIYNGVETITDTLESLIGKVDDVLILDGRWIGVEGATLHSNDGSIEAVGDFALKHPQLPVTIILAEKPMHQVESRTFLINQVPSGDWILVIDSDEVVIRWVDIDLKDFLEKTDEEAFAVFGKRLQCPLPTIRLFKKVEGLHYKKDHRRLLDKNGRELLYVNYFKLPIQIAQHPKRATKAMRAAMRKYRDWLWKWEHDKI